MLDKRKNETLQIIGIVSILVLLVIGLCLLAILAERLSTFIDRYIAALTPLLMEVQIALLPWVPLIGISLGLMIVYYLNGIHRAMLDIKSDVSKLQEIARK